MCGMCLQVRLSWVYWSCLCAECVDTCVWYVLSVFLCVSILCVHVLNAFTSLCLCVQVPVYVLNAFTSLSLYNVLQCYNFVLWRQGSVYVFSVFTSLSSEGRAVFMCSVCLPFCPLKAGFCICVQCVYKFVL